jgi:hypothetical protein
LAAIRDIERRQFLKFLTRAAGGLGSVGCLILRPPEAAAKTQCTGARAKRVCTVSINRAVQRVVIKPGKNPVGACWVTSLHMIFAYHGYTVSPARISVEAYGGKVPTTPWQKLDLVSRKWVDDNGRPFVAKLEAMPVRAADAAEALAEDQPPIVGVAGRPTVLSAMTYTGDRLGGMTIVKAQVCDPYPGKHPRIVTSPEWVDVRYIARVTLTKGLAKS